MEMHRKTFVGLLGVAGLAMWLLIAGPATLLGIDTGNAGMVLLTGTAWVALYAVSRMPRGEVDRVPPGEWKAWIGLGFMTVAIVYFVTHVQVFAHGGPWDNPDASRVGRNLVMLLIAWIVLSGVMRSRWHGKVEEDERDRQIAARAQGFGHGAMVSGVIALALLLGFSPPARLEWATHFMIGNLLVFGLMVACLVEYAARAGLYWKDRR